jgi:hypothetical protein
MAHFLKSGNTYKVASEEAMDIHSTLPAGNYVIKIDMFENLYLEHIDSFNVSGKIYGDTLKNTDRIINTFWERPSSTGVMLTGEKGSGKTLLSKKISIELAKQAVPTIVINDAFTGEKFNTLLQTISQPCIILFDEFEKVYDKDEQEAILTLLDGVYSGKKLFILTCNDKWRVDQHMRNRPGRIFYMIDFTGLSQEFIVEYCEDNLKHKEHIDRICSLTNLFAEFNFDMLKALVEEMNRYNEAPQDAMKILNTKPEFDSGCRYEVSLIVEGKELTVTTHPEVFEGNPLANTVQISYDSDKDEDGDTQWITNRFSPQDLVKVDNNGARFLFENKGIRLMLTRIKAKTYNPYAF